VREFPRRWMVAVTVQMIVWMIVIMWVIMTVWVIV
jgi:hypothetical protein